QAYKDYLDVGCNVLTTCTLQASVQALQEHLDIGVSEAEELIAASVTLPQKIVQGKRTDDDVNCNPITNAADIRIAGSVGSYGAYLYDGSEYTGDYTDKMSVEELRDWHRPRVQCLVRSGCDLLAFETIPAVQEALALMQLLREHPGIKAWLSFGCQDEKLTAKGECFKEAVQTVLGKDSESQICAIGVNCCRPDVVCPLLKGVHEEGQPPLVAYTDAEFVPGMLVLEDHAQLGKNVAEWYDAGVRYFGGCCFTGADHITTIVQALAAMGV
ncbi:unnamed protein product, partial [Ixodes hexagonus]